MRQIAKLSQVKIAERLNVAPSTVHRHKHMDIALFLAACDLQIVPASYRGYDPEYVKSLKVLASVGLAAPEPDFDGGDD